MHNLSVERTAYPTQKPEKLLERIISASSNPEDLAGLYKIGWGKRVERVVEWGWDGFRRCMT